MQLHASKIHPGLMMDLYHPDAAYVSWQAGRNGLATFDLYTRTAPFGGAYLLVAGIEAALEFVQAFRYTPEELHYLAQIRDYDVRFLDELAQLRFTGEILALPEGSIAFPNEPLLRVTAPFREALLIESAVMQAVNLATLIATKAARVVSAAEQGRPRRVAEFAFRRAQEPMTVARSSYIGGCASTSLLNAAFEAIAACYNRYTLLLDTYDARQAIHTAIRVAQRAQQDLGHTLVAVRLDSGDVLQLAGEPHPDGYHRLLRPVMRNGEIVAGSLPPLSEIRELAQAQLQALPAPYRALLPAQPYPVRLSESLQALRAQATHLAETSWG